MNNEITPIRPVMGGQLTRAEQHDRAEITRHARRVLDRVAVDSAVAVASEQARALLTEEALLNVGALSALETHLIQIAPLGAPRYQAIVDGYALGAAQAIGRWGR